MSYPNAEKKINKLFIKIIKINQVFIAEIT